MLRSFDVRAAGRVTPQATCRLRWRRSSPIQATLQPAPGRAGRRRSHGHCRPHLSSSRCEPRGAARLRARPSMVRRHMGPTRGSSFARRCWTERQGRRGVTGGRWSPYRRSLTIHRNPVGNRRQTRMRKPAPRKPVRRALRRRSSPTRQRCWRPTRKRSRSTRRCSPASSRRHSAASRRARRARRVPERGHGL